MAFEMFFAGFGVSVATWLTVRRLSFFHHACFLSLLTACFTCSTERATRATSALRGASLSPFPIAISLIYFSLIHFLPESPRWCVSVGKHDDAQYILDFLHGSEVAARDLARTMKACRAFSLPSF
jgi:hypothetical protein